jgi:hypothetical protein
VAAVLAQMRGDAVGAGRDGDMGGPDRVGMNAAAGIAQGGHVVDIDPKAEMRKLRQDIDLIN